VPPLSGRHLSCDGTLSFGGDISERVVDYTGRADLRLDPADADGPDEELHLALLPDKCALHGRPYL